MADQEPKTENPGINEDDTRTRKTVRLKSPSVTPTSIKLPAAAPITDPMTGRDTDTGNLDVLADTQTRRTVKLKPLAPQKAANTPIKLEGAGVTTTTTVTPIPAGGMDTQTRKTVVLKPAAPAGIKLDGADTQTRKTVVLRPSVAPASGVRVSPAAAPAAGAEDAAARKTVALHPAPAAPAEEEDDTRTRKTVVLKPSAATPAGLKIEKEDADDATIRIQRPPRTAPAAPAPAPAAPAPAPAPAPAQATPRKTVELPAEALVPENEIQKTMELDTSDLVDEKATVKLAPPKHPVPPPVPAVKKTGKVEAEEPEKAPKAEEKAEEAKEAVEENAAAPAEEAVAAGKKQKKVKAPRPEYVADERRPSAAYLAMAVITLILMIGTATLTTVQYLNLCQNQNIELPGLGK